MLKITRYILIDILKNKLLIIYSFSLLCIGTTLFEINDDYLKGLSGLISVIFIIIPLMSCIFTTTYYYNNFEFKELLLTMPIQRRDIFLGEFLGIALAQSIFFLAGLFIRIIVFAYSSTGLMLLLTGTLLIWIFVAIALWISVTSKEKAKGISATILSWILFSIVYDGFLLLLLIIFNNYSLEKSLIGIISLNPIDLGRILVLLQSDNSALMGYTGAVYKKFFGLIGSFYLIFCMLLWVLIPMIFALKKFKNKNI